MSDRIDCLTSRDRWVLIVVELVYSYGNYYNELALPRRRSCSYNSGIVCVYIVIAGLHR